MSDKPPTPKALPKRRKPLSKQDQDVIVVVPSNDDDKAETESQAPRVQSKDVQGLKDFDMLLPLLERLYGEQCGRDKAGNRELFFDKYCVLVLLCLFNPTVTSLRAMAQSK